MLKELKNVRQRPEEGTRRWFTDEDFDLIIWYSKDEELVGFQLCYGKEAEEHALTWRVDGSYNHSRIDEGRGGGRAKQTAILVADDTTSNVDSDDLAKRFRSVAEEVDPDIAEMVLDRLHDYGSQDRG